MESATDLTFPNKDRFLQKKRCKLMIYEYHKPQRKFYIY